MTAAEREQQLEFQRLINVLNSYYDKEEYFLKRGTFPLKTTDDLFLCLVDGVIFCRLLMMISPGCIPANKIATDVDVAFIKAKLTTRNSRTDPNTRSIFQITQNLNQFTQAAAKIPECSSIKINQEDMIQIRSENVFGALTFLLRAAIISRVNVLYHPSLVRLLEKGESADVIQMMEPEKLVVRWVNYHLKRSAYPSTIVNTSTDLKDSGVLLTLIKHIAPKEKVDMEAVDAALSIAPSRSERPVVVAECTAKMDLAATITVKDIVLGDRSALLTGLSAMLDKYPNIDFPTEEQLNKLEVVVRDLRAKVKELEDTVTVAGSDSNKKLFDELDQMGDELAKLKEEKEKLEFELAAERKDNGSLRDKLAHAQEQLKQERENAKKERESIKESLTQNSKQTVDERFKSISDTFQGMVDSRDKVIEELQGKVRGLNDKIAELNHELANEKKKNEGMTHNSEDLMKEVQDAITKIQNEMLKEQGLDPRSPPAEKKSKKKDKEKDKSKGSVRGQKSSSIIPENENDPEKLKAALVVADKKIKYLEDLVKHLEDELEEEKKAFDELVDLQKKHSDENQKATSSALANRRQTMMEDTSKGETGVLKEALELLTEALGEDAAQAVKKEQSTLASQIKYLVNVLCDLKQDLEKRLGAAEVKLEKNKEINEIMKQKIGNYVLEQMKGKNSSKLPFFS